MILLCLQKRDYFNPRAEFLAPMPKGTYYFTISSTQWQKIPYSVDVQAIRFVGLKGVVTSPALLLHDCYCQVHWPCTAYRQFAATVPSSAQLKQPTGPATMLLHFQRLQLSLGAAIGYFSIWPTKDDSQNQWSQRPGANVATLMQRHLHTAVTVPDDD